jgi:hypothetical protein
MPMAILANMPPPSYYINIPTDQEELYQLAGPIFLSLAATFAGWWLIRYRSLKTVSGRVMFLACAGSLAVSYTAFWIWCNRVSGLVSPSIAATLANQMHLYWAGFCMLFFVYTRWNRNVHVNANAEKSGTRPLKMLESLMVIGAVSTFVLAPSRWDVWPMLLVAFWSLAFVIWGIVSGIRSLAFSARG